MALLTMLSKIITYMRVDETLFYLIFNQFSVQWILFYQEKNFFDPKVLDMMQDVKEGVWSSFTK